MHVDVGRRIGIEVRVPCALSAAASGRLGRRSRCGWEENPKGSDGPTSTDARWRVGRPDAVNRTRTLVTATASADAHAAVWLMSASVTERPRQEVEPPSGAITLRLLTVVFDPFRI